MVKEKNAVSLSICSDDDEESTQFAFFVESNIPARWDDTEQIDWKAPKKVLTEV